METYTANLGKVQRREMEEKTWLVAPVVMLVEGVHNGLLYAPYEMSRLPETWNHKPVTLNHPTHEGNPISACYPEILTRQKVGVIMNARWDSENSKLRAEAWIDETALRAKNPTLLSRIESGETIEVSTGLFTENEMVEGTWRGESYSGIARNHKADHLAILPDQKGACSCEKGCGINHNNERLTTMNQIPKSIGRPSTAPKDAPKSQVAYWPQPMAHNQSQPTNNSGTPTRGIGRPTTMPLLKGEAPEPVHNENGERIPATGIGRPSTFFK